MWILQAMMTMWSDVVSSLSLDFCLLNFSMGTKWLGLFFLFFLTRGCGFIDWKQGWELKCPDYGGGGLRSFGLTDTFFFFFV